MEKFRSCWEACMQHDVDAVRRALDDGFVVDSRHGLFNETLLHESARYGCREIVSMLLEYKADVNVQNMFGSTPLHVSAWSGHKEIFSLLLANMDNVNVTNKHGYTPLHYSAGCGHKEIVSMLLSKKADVNVQDKGGKTPLHKSVWSGHTEIVSLLLENKADVNVQDKGGMTPLHLSVLNGHTEIVSLLLENKADVNVKCEEGLSPIDYADKTEVVNVLLQYGAVRYNPNFMERFVSRFRFRVQSKTTTRSVKVTVTPGVEDNKDRSASASFSHTQTIEIKDEVTNTIRNDETISDPAQIYENTDQHKIPGSQTISTSEGGQVLASAIAGCMEQAVNDCLNKFPEINSTYKPPISSDASISQQNGAPIVNINITSNVTVNNEIIIQDTRDVNCQNAQIKKPTIVAYNSPIKVVNSSRKAHILEDDDDESDDEPEK